MIVLNKKNILRLILAFIILLVISVGIAFFFFRSKVKQTDHTKVDNIFGTYITEGDCQIAYDLVKDEAKTKTSFDKFQKFCQILNGKTLIYKGSTADVDLDMDTEETHIYEIFPSINEGKYLAIGTFSFYDVEKVSNIYFSNSKDCLGMYFASGCPSNSQDYKLQ